jgi:predicted ATP-dependent endonuclease of OLD family
VFASVVVLGDGTTEAACLPILLRRALGDLARDVVVLDPGGMKNLDVISMVIKVARSLETEWCLFVDDDKDGRDAAQKILRKMCTSEEERENRRVMCSGGALEQLLMKHSPEIARSAAEVLRPDASLPDEKAVERVLKRAKGASGRHLAYALCETHPDVASWPDPLRALVDRVRAMLQ